MRQVAAADRIAHWIRRHIAATARNLPDLYVNFAVA
jgi:hypothetical protein